MFRAATAGLVALLFIVAPLGGREPVNDEVNARIRKEAREHSYILRTVHYLTDVYGPRLTGSPNHKAAGEWAIKQMTEWGLTNGRLEPWDFGHPGWLNERFSGFIVSPVKDSLVGEVLAWTPSTNGTVSSDAVQIVPPDRPTQDLLTRWIAETTPKVKGRIVLVGRHTMVPVTINKSPLRRDDEQLRRQYQSDGGPGPQGPQGPRGNAAPDRRARTTRRHSGRRTDRRDARRGGRAGPGQRRRPASRPDPRLQQPDVRPRQGGANGGAAQRGLRPDRAHPRRRHAGAARVRPS